MSRDITGGGRDQRSGRTPDRTRPPSRVGRDRRHSGALARDLIRLRFYRLHNQMLQPYAILMCLSKGIINESMIQGRPTVPLVISGSPPLSS